MSPTVECGPGHAEGRRRRMEVFVDAVDTLLLLESTDDPDVADAIVSLRVTAGIAAADVICCARLGRRARGANHRDAVGLLGSVDKALANHLRRLLQLKPKAQYGALAVSGHELRTSARAVETLVEAARGT
jgi:hypothetical protein